MAYPSRQEPGRGVLVRVVTSVVIALLSGTLKAGSAIGRSFPAQDNCGVRKAAEADGPQLLATLARAYYEDPLFAWYFPDDSRRLQQLQRVLALLGAQIFAYDETYTAGAVSGGEDVVGAALWVSPDHWRMCPFTWAAAVGGLASSVGMRQLPRSLGGLYLTQSRHPQEPPHYYLPFIGVEREWQARGVGSALMQPILARCDCEGLSACAEATSPRSRAFLERNGFGVLQEMALRSSPPMWLMWRGPGP